MCLRKEGAEIAERDVQISRSPWRRLIRQQFKPKLSRNVVTTAKVNLNRYWSKFEELSTHKIPIMTIFTNTPTPPNPNGDNEINENILNEKMELGN